MSTARWLANAGGAVAVLAAALVVRSVIAGGTAPEPVAAAAPSPARLDSATLRVRGILTAAGLAAAADSASGAQMLIVLRARDRQVCEDLGRQLRELLRAVGTRYPAVLVTDDSATDEYRVFASRERLRVRVVGVAPDSVISGQRLPTPAVLVREPGGAVEGIAHPLRFQNLRTRSFATELQPLLHR